MSDINLWDVVKAIKIPSNEAEWSQVASVDEGVKSFSRNSVEAGIITELLRSGRIMLSVPPDRVRALYPFLHSFKKASFQGFYYKARTELRGGETMEAAEGSVPTNITVATPVANEALPKGKLGMEFKFVYL